MTMKEFGVCSGDNSVHSFGTLFCKYRYCWVLTVSVLILPIHLAFYVVSIRIIACYWLLCELAGDCDTCGYQLQHSNLHFCDCSYRHHILFHPGIMSTVHENANDISMSFRIITVVTVNISKSLISFTSLCV